MNDGNNYGITSLLLSPWLWLCCHLNERGLRSLAKEITVSWQGRRVGRVLGRKTFKVAVSSSGVFPRPLRGHNMRGMRVREKVGERCHCFSYSCGICSNLSCVTLEPVRVSPSGWLWRGAWWSLQVALSHFLSQELTKSFTAPHTHAHPQTHNNSHNFPLLENSLFCWVT